MTDIPRITYQFKRFVAKILARSIAALLPSNIMRDKTHFHLWEEKGYHVTPVHYYEPIPDTRSLRNKLWEKRSELVGINFNDVKQRNLLSVFATRFKKEYDAFPKERTSSPHEFYLTNGYFMSVDAEVLYCMIRYFQPRRVIEIGSGFSTLLSASALLQNKKEGIKGELISIEPFPNETLLSGFPRTSKLVVKEVQEVPMQEFLKLKRNDMLFIDSSHVMKAGSDVQFEFLEILPRLHKGVIIHMHDIYLPFEYPRAWIMENKIFWNEQYLLHAFLIFNNRYEVLWSSAYHHFMHSDTLRAAFNSYDPTRALPGSFYIRKTR